MSECRGNEGVSTQQGGRGGQSGVSRALGVTGLQWDSNDMLAEYCVHGAAEILIEATWTRSKHQTRNLDHQ